MTYFMLVFGELVPKQIAIANPEKTARVAIIPISILSKITKPLVFLLSASSSLVLKLIGVDPTKGESVTEEDVLLMMREGHQQGEIEDVEVQVVSNLFEFTDLRVEDAMTHRTEIQAIPIDSTLADIATMVSETGFNKFPVTDGNIDEIVGILYSKDTDPLFPSLKEGSPSPSLHQELHTFSPLCPGKQNAGGAFFRNETDRRTHGCRRGRVWRHFRHHHLDGYLRRNRR